MDVPSSVQNPAADSSAGSSAPLPSIKASSNDPIIMISGQPLTLGQFMGPLIEAHGLTMLLNLTQLELVKQDAARNHVVVTDKDVEEEREATLESFARTRMNHRFWRPWIKPRPVRTGGDCDCQERSAGRSRGILTQFLVNQHIDPVEFDIVLKINTYLRKIAEPQIAGKIDDAALHAPLGRCTAKKCMCTTSSWGIWRKSASQAPPGGGDHFEDVAKDMSINRASGALGGDLPPSRGKPMEFPTRSRRWRFR